MDEPLAIAYNGYRFKNILEARWAVFFDQLGIAYQYEPQEYIFEETPYTPTFYLPQHDYVIDIFEEKPTQEDWEKAFLFALYEGKTIYMFAGDVWLPGEPNSYHSYLALPPRLFTYPEEEGLGADATEEVKMPQMVRILLQNLDESGTEVVVRHNHLELRSKNHLYPDNIAEGIEEYVQWLADQQEYISELAPFVIQYAEEIINTLTPKKGYEMAFIEQSEHQGLSWAECSTCREFSLVFSLKNEDKEQREHFKCKFPNHGLFIFNTPRLLAAYASARQAKFEE
jgi:hypothetical protein